jgi:hypothetical protein
MLPHDGPMLAGAQRYSAAGSGQRAVPEWLEEFLFHPRRFFGRLLRTILEAVSHLMPITFGLLVTVVLLVLALRGWRWLRERRLSAGARRIRILPPPEADPARARALWMGLHALLRPWTNRLVSGQPHLTWEIVAYADDVEIAVWVPPGVPAGFVERAVHTAWPGAGTDTETASLDPVSSFCRSDGVAVEGCELTLAEGEWFPIGGAPEDDPQGLALAALSGLADGEAAAIQVVAQPATSRAGRGLRRAARILRAGGRPGWRSWRIARGHSGSRPSSDPTLEADVRSILAKGSSPLWRCVVRVAVRAPTRAEARGRIHGLAGAFAMFEGRNGFRRRRIPGGLRAMRHRRLARPYLLSVPELARVASLPSSNAFPGLELSRARTVPPPRALATAGKIIGGSDHPGMQRSVAITVEDARHHIHVIGETGTGKSTLLANLALQDAVSGRSAVVVDPKGDLVEAILERLPDGAEGRTCVVDPDDRSSAVGLNVLAGDDPDLVVDHVNGVFKRIYEPWWGPRTDHIMRAACLTLTQIPGATLAEVPVLLTDYQWRRAIRDRLSSDSWVLGFWDLYDRMQESQRQSHIAPLLNKLGGFLLRGPVRAIVGQVDPKLHIAEFLDAGGLLLVRIPKGTLGEETSRLLGAFVIARVWQAAMRRARHHEVDRPDTTLYVDEVHNYLVLPRSFEDLLAEARGYRLSLVLAHQHLGQLPREMRDALGANARTKVVFTSSPEDALQLRRHFAPQLTDYDLSHLGAFQAACRPCIAGGRGAAFTFRTEPLGPGSPERAKEVRRANEVFARPRAEVEEEIGNRQAKAADWLLPGMDPTGRWWGRPGGRSMGPSEDPPRPAHPNGDEDPDGSPS